MAQPFVIDGICHPYDLPERGLRGCFGYIFNDVLYAFHPPINPAVLSKEEWQHDRRNDEFVETMFLEGDAEITCVHSVPVQGKDGIRSILTNERSA